MTVHLLALETSSSLCDVAVVSARNGDQHVYRASHDATGQHAERLLPMVDQVLAQAGLSRHDLSAVAFGQGPGGFTGLRVACGVAQGMAFGLDIPVVPVSSLLAIAQQAHSQQEESKPAHAYHMVLQDARMGEVYLAVYQPPQALGQAWRTIQEPMLIGADDVAHWIRLSATGQAIQTGTPVWLSGDALQAYATLSALIAPGAGVQFAGDFRADAPSIARLGLAALARGETVLPDHAAPLYVRDKVAFTTSERQQGAGGNPRAAALAVTLHPMQADHLDAVAAIESRVQSFPWTRRNFADGLGAGYPAWVACQAGRVIGFYMAMMAPDVAHLLVIAVDPSSQAQGVGKQLIQHFQTQAQAGGLDTLVLEVRISNHSAIGFYQHLGFQGFTRRKDYYPAPQGKREDASVMKKTLSVQRDDAHA